MLQQMRSAVKYIWLVLAAAFVGGYLLVDTSGLLGRQLVTAGTSIGSVDGTSITYGDWVNRSNQLAQQYEQQSGHSVDLDVRAQLDNQAFEEMVGNILMNKEYARRGIRISDDEIREAAKLYPPPEATQNPDLQTDGRFDPAKWDRFLASPAVRQQGFLLNLQRYYEDQLPRVKFYQQLAADVYESDASLWRRYQDAHDSASISFIAFRPAPGTDTLLKSKVTDAEVLEFYQANKKRLATPSHGVVTALVISRAPTASDSAAAHNRIIAERKRIAAGEKFEAVAKEVSDDSGSAKDGGKLPPFTHGTFNNPAFEGAAFKLKPGETSDPVLSPSGWHIIHLDSRKGDTLTARHILVAIKQTDSSATRTDRLADRLAKIAASSEDGKKLDSAAKELGLTPIVVDVVEGQRAIGPDASPLPGLAQWATGGTSKVGEISELFDSDKSYFLARLDSLVAGGEATLDRVRNDIRLHLARTKAGASRLADAEAFARAATATSFDAAAKAQGLKVESAGPYARLQFVAGLGQGNPALGAAFGLAVGAVSAPIITDDAVYVVRVDKRINADRTAWQAQLAAQRTQVDQQLQQERVRQYLAALRDEANVVDKRKEVFAAGRRK